jgi:hypothetical protein
MWALLLVLLGCLQVSRSFRSDSLPSQKIFTRQPVRMVSTDSQPQSNRSLRATGLWRALRVGGALAAGGLVATRPALAGAELVLPECSDTIIALRNAAGRQIVVIGTAHISEDSVRLVRSTIRALNPDTVMIELDKKRVGKVNEGKTLKELGFAVPQDQEEGPIVVDGKAGRKNLFMQLVDSVRDSFTSSVQGAAGAVLGMLCTVLYAACCLLYACCMLAVCCLLLAGCWVLCAVCCLQCIVCFVLLAECCVLLFPSHVLSLFSLYLCLSHTLLLLYRQGAGAVLQQRGEAGVHSWWRVQGSG